MYRYEPMYFYELHWRRTLRRYNFIGQDIGWCVIFVACGHVPRR